jgi:hypothetical protein
MRVLGKCLAFLLIALYIGLGSSFAQNFRASLDSTKILIGNQTTLTISVKVEEGKRVLFFHIPDSLAKGVEVVKRLPIDTSEVDGGTILTQKVVLTSFDSGSYVLPKIPVIYFDGKKADTLYSQAFTLKVKGVAVDSTKRPLYGIKGNYRASYSFWEIFFFALAVLFLVAFIFWLYRFFRKGNSEPIFSFKTKVVEPAHVVAFRELEQLKQKKLWQNGREKEYYSELTDILRRYMEARLKISAMEMTSFEIMSALKGYRSINKPLFDNLSDMLETSDLVKFAKHTSTPQESEDAAACVYKFVEETKEEAVKQEANMEGQEAVHPKTEENK